uniref:Chromosome 1 open reading frame 74 n=1 Tax=Anas platyrhynchos platyrhynchos TaxID=8840 RepID=A0A493T8R3_ANAPP
MEAPEPLPAPQLVAAAREALGAGSGRRRRRLPASRALHLAGEVLAVAAGLKPALLYDCGAEGPAELRRYLERLREAGLAPHRLHLLAAGGSALLLHPGGARRRLEAALRARPGPFVDVAAARGSPQLCGPAQAQAIRGHLAALLAHLVAAEEASSGPISCSEVVATGWNLCTVFGVLLGYPAAYHFPVEEGGENCLALRPLRVFTVQARCPRIQDGLGVQIYSFSIPESLREELREVLDAWCDDLRDSFRAQSDFVDLCISSEVVSLPAVAL